MISFLTLLVLNPNIECKQCPELDYIMTTSLEMRYFVYDTFFIDAFFIFNRNLLVEAIVKYSKHVMDVKAGPDYMALYFKLLCFIHLVTDSSKPFKHPQIKASDINWCDNSPFPLAKLRVMSNKVSRYTCIHAFSFFMNHYYISVCK